MSWCCAFVLHQFGCQTDWWTVTKSRTQREEFKLKNSVKWFVIDQWIVESLLQTRNKRNYNWLAKCENEQVKVFKMNFGGKTCWSFS